MHPASPQDQTLATELSVPSVKAFTETLYDLEAISRSIVEPLCKKYELNKMALFVLLNLEQIPDQNPSRLSQALHAKRTNIASTLRNLEYKGLITIGTGVEDKRNRLVNLTESGQKIAASITVDLEAERLKLMAMVPQEVTQKLSEAWEAFCNSVSYIAKELNIKE